MARYYIQKRTHKDGRTVSYQVQVLLPEDGTGKRERKTGTFPTKKEAEKVASQWVSEIDGGIVVKTSPLTVSDVCKQWLDVKRHDLKPRTLEHYEATLECIAGKIGTMPVQRVTPSTLDALYALLRDAGKSEHTLHRVHQRLLQVFDYAVKRRIVVVNPVLAIDAPITRPEAPTVLSVPQIGRFLTFAQYDGYNPFWLLLVQTGMRRGEALGVRWQDVDLQKGKLSICQTVEALAGKPHINTPKTTAARRTITLFPESVAALKAHRTRQLERKLAAVEWDEHDLVFTTEAGRPLNPNNVLRNFYLIVKRANEQAEKEDDRDALLPAFTIHDLRHTHATHLLLEGYAVPTVSRRLGHANPGITMTIYAHALSDVQGEDLQTPAAFAFTGTA